VGSNRETLRGGDIEAIRSKMRDEGRPLKSSIVIKEGKHHHYEVDHKTGRVEVKEIIGR